MELAEKLKKVVEDILKDQPGVELVDLTSRAQGGNQLITVLVDTEKGILLDQCVKINKLIGQRLEENEVFKTKYKIEVCSPGMDRVLKTTSDFKRVCGKTIRLTTLEPILNDRVVVGVLNQVIDNKIVVGISQDNQVEINLDNIKQARLEIRW
ncbi:MAG: hypothetical protein V1747_02825 [Candidatus Omnitrophota bacterium]